MGGSPRAPHIALVQPVPIDPAVLTFYLPLAFVTTAVVSGFMLTKRVPRWAGSVFILVYAVFVMGEWFMEVHRGSVTLYWGQERSGEGGEPDGPATPRAATDHRW